MKFILIVGLISISFATVSQTATYPFKQLHQLDSIGKTDLISKHFGGLYFIFLQSIESQLAAFDTTPKKLIRKFEAVFAQFYLDACKDYYDNQPIKITDWQKYFSKQGLLPIQYKLLGANAHLNGRLWEAFANSFTLEEMNALKKEFRIFKKTLNKTYRHVYDEARDELKFVSTLRSFTFGLDELLGYHYLYKWRKRQMRLARFYLSKSERFEPLFAKVEKKREAIDKLIFSLR